MHWLIFNVATNINHSIRKPLRFVTKDDTNMSIQMLGRNLKSILSQSFNTTCKGPDHYTANCYMAEFMLEKMFNSS